MQDLLERFAMEIRLDTANVNIRRGTMGTGSMLGEDRTEFQGKQKPVFVRSSSVPQDSRKSFSSISPSLSIDAKRRLFREALESTVQETADSLGNRIESECENAIKSGLKRKLQEIHKTLQEDLQESLSISKIALRTHLKKFVFDEISKVDFHLNAESPKKTGTDLSLNLDEEGWKKIGRRQEGHGIRIAVSSPDAGFAREKSSETSKNQSFRSSKSQKTKAAKALQRFLEASCCVVAAI